MPNIDIAIKNPVLTRIYSEGLVDGGEYGSIQMKMSERGNSWLDEDARCLLNIWSKKKNIFWIVKRKHTKTLECFKCLLLYSQETTHKGNGYTAENWKFHWCELVLSAMYQNKLQVETTKRLADDNMSCNCSLKIKWGLCSDQHCVKKRCFLIHSTAMTTPGLWSRWNAGLSSKEVETGSNFATKQYNVVHKQLFSQILLVG